MATEKQIKEIALKAQQMIESGENIETVSYKVICSLLEIEKNENNVIEHMVELGFERGKAQKIINVIKNEKNKQHSKSKLLLVNTINSFKSLLDLPNKYFIYLTLTALTVLYLQSALTSSELKPIKWLIFSVIFIFFIVLSVIDEKQGKIFSYLKLITFNILFFSNGILAGLLILGEPWGDIGEPSIKAGGIILLIIGLFYLAAKAIVFIGAFWSGVLLFIFSINSLNSAINEWQKIQSKK